MAVPLDLTALAALHGRGLGLAEAKAVIDAVPSTVRRGLSKKAAEAWKAAIEDACGTAEVRESH